MQYQMLATDYDNTLVCFGEEDPRPAVAAGLRRMQAMGGKLTVCTGRCLAALRAAPAIRHGLAYDYAVCSNGACVVDKAGNVLYEDPLTAEDMYALVDFCEDYDYPIEFAFSDAYYAYVGYDAFREYYGDAARYGLVFKDGEDQDRHLTEKPSAAFVMMPGEALARFTEKYGYLGIEFVCLHEGYRPGWFLYDVMHAGVDKGEGLKGLCRAIGLPLTQVAAAGDGNNDCGMLAAAGLGCAMGNATPAAKAAAGRVLGDVQHAGLAGLLDELWPEAESGAAAP